MADFKRNTVIELNVNEFIKYMHNEFPSVFKGMAYFQREWLENTVQWVTETYENDYEKQMAALESMLPEIEEEEIIKFWKEKRI